MNDNPSWHFPHRAWGLDVIKASSSTHFRDDPIPKLVRAILQNSLNANDRDLDGPVEVEITERPVDPKNNRRRGTAETSGIMPGQGQGENRRNVQSFYERS